MIVYLAGRRLHIKLDAHTRVIGLANTRRKHPDAQRIERLRLTFDAQRIEGDTLYLGTVGFAELAAMIGASVKTGRSLHDRLCAYFPGDPLFNEMCRATVRAHVPGATAAVGDEAYFLKLALAQIAANQSPQQHSPFTATRH